ncbi:stage II sporulation protein M [Fontibacillus panacisegetis]|uniref:Stage II sporulation protein M n=1 Tax=Fontibacillus panacisegetis TaxID=670482 RepID=A0A1G7RXH0_9BACL|nr:stage II sporulation protein M [Fontibacillus panacisegetis]SDG14919.1 stage II sporulation protein M [Fontibacillus panacisegetis]
MLSWRLFIKDLRQFKVAMGLAFVLFTIGVILGAANSDALVSLVSGDVEQIRELSRKLSETAIPELSFFTFIFLNNAIKSVVVIFMGAIFGVIPLIFLLMNGVILGWVVAMTASQGADLFDLIVRGLLPHGIIEIPAIIIASGFGLQFGYLVLKGLGELGARDSSERTIDLKAFMRSAGRGAFWIVILLLVAAVIESTLTFYLVR